MFNKRSYPPQMMMMAIMIMMITARLIQLFFLVGSRCFTSSKINSKNIYFIRNHENFPWLVDHASNVEFWPFEIKFALTSKLVYCLTWRLFVIGYDTNNHFSDYNQQCNLYFLIYFHFSAKYHFVIWFLLEQARNCTCIWIVFVYDRFPIGMLLLRRQVDRNFYLAFVS